jgi:hypothetical protein
MPPSVGAIAPYFGSGAFRASDWGLSQLDETDGFDSASGQAGLAVFDFSQNLVPWWHGSDSVVSAGSWSA